MINKKFKLEEVKKFLKKKGFVVLKKNNSKIFHKDIKSFYLTTLASLGIILFFFFTSSLRQLSKKYTFILYRD